MPTQINRITGMVIAASINAAPRSFLRRLVRMRCWAPSPVASYQLLVASYQLPVAVSTRAVPRTPPPAPSSNWRLETEDWKPSSHQRGQDAPDGDRRAVREPARGR